MSIRNAIILASILLCNVAISQEQISPEEVREIIKEKIERTIKLGTSSLLVNAVKEQNALGMSLDTIKKIDQEWMSSNDPASLDQSQQATQVGNFLRSKVESNKGVYSGIILMDNQGANVDAYPVTPDYWQGDEAIWSASFNEGDGKVYIGPVEYDKKTKSDAIQISVPVIDDGITIGVLVVGIKLSFIELMRLKKRF